MTGSLVLHAVVSLNHASQQLVEEYRMIKLLFSVIFSINYRYNNFLTWIFMFSTACSVFCMNIFNWFFKEALKLKQSFKEISLPLELILRIVKTEVILNMFHY